MFSCPKFLWCRMSYVRIQRMLTKNIDSAAYKTQFNKRRSILYVHTYIEVMLIVNVLT
jgi:hypothetical protein